MMQDIFRQYPVVFPVLLFLTMWLVGETLFGLLSGWYSLAARFRDQPEEPLFRLSRASGTMGLGIPFHGSICVCRSGLRMAAPWLFCRPFLVPWDCLTITRKTWLFNPMAWLKFGGLRFGRLFIHSWDVDRLARAAGEYWPERSAIPTPPTAGDVARQLLTNWALVSGFFAIFMTIVPRLLSPGGPGVSFFVAVVLPGVAFGIFALVTFFRETSHGEGR